MKILHRLREWSRGPLSPLPPRGPVVPLSCSPLPPRGPLLLWSCCLLFLLAGAARADVTNVWSFEKKTNYYMPDEDVYVEVDEVGERAQLVLLAEEKHYPRIADYTAPGAINSLLTFGPPVNITLTRSGANYNSYGVFTSRVFSNAPAGNRWKYLEAKGSNLDYIPDSTLVALYSMDDDGWRDRVSGAFGVPIGSPDFVTDSGRGSHAGRFQGPASGDYVVLPNSALLKNEDEFTVACWFKLRKHTTFAGLVTALGVGQRIAIMQVYAQNEELLFGIWDQFGASSHAMAAGVKSNQWHLAVGTWSRLTDGYARLYIDGQLAAIAPTAATSQQSQHDSLKVGVEDGSVPSRCTDGLIDEVAVWRRALSSNEIANLYYNSSMISPLRFQVRSSDTLSGLAARDFVGPDGSTNAFYAASSEGLSSAGDFSISNRFVQYQAHLLSSTNRYETPYVEAVGFFGTEIVELDSTVHDLSRGTFTLNTGSTAIPSAWPFIGLSKMRNGSYNATGVYTSRVMRAVSGPASTWNEISWTAAGEQLTDNSSGMVGMYHCANSWADSCSVGGVQSGNDAGVTYTGAAKLGTQSAVFDEDNTALVDNFGLGNIRSLEFWISNDRAQNSIMALTPATSIVISNRMVVASGFVKSPRIYVNGNSLSPKLKGGWNHVAVVWASNVDAIGLTVGRVGTAYMTGKMDEMAVYNRALYSSEIIEHYVRGRPEIAGDIRFQARASDDPTFAGVNFVGFGGTTGDYHNVPGTLATGPGEYFQYRILLDGEGDATPGVCSVRVTYNAFADQFNDNAVSNFFAGSLYHDPALQWYGDEMGLRDWSALAPPSIRPVDYGGVVGLWHLENNWVDDAGGGVGIPQGGAQLSRSSKIGGYCAAFDGVNGKVTLGSGALGSNPFSVALWMRTDATNRCALISSYSGGQHFTLEHLSNGSVSFIIDNFLAGAPNPRTVTSSRIGLNDGRWHHVIGMRNANQILIYVDGDLVGAQNISATYGGIGGAGPVLGYSSASTYFAGALDEVAIFNYALKPAEVGEISGAGVATRQAASHISATVDASLPAIWENMSWSAHGIYNNAVSELDPSVVGLWHLDEATGGGVALDATVNGNDGAVPGAAQGVAGRFGKAVNLDGTSQSISIPNDPGVLEPGTLTIEAWVKLDSVVSAPVFHKRNAGLNAGYALGTDAAGKPYFWVGTGAGSATCTGYGVLRSGQWYHLAGLYDGRDICIYANGEQVGKGTPAAVSIPAGNATIGVNISGTERLDGLVDEVALYNRPLSAAEILDHYKAGAVSLKFQARAWDPPPQGSFVGPGTNTGTYFTEWYGTDLRTGLELGQYMQYKAFLSSEDHRYGPVLQGVNVDHSSYSDSNPTVEPNEANASNFVGRLIAFNHDVNFGTRTDVRYQISGDAGPNPAWYYWDVTDGVWSNATGLSPQYGFASSRDQINANIGSFYDQLYDKVGGVLRFRAFLHSEGDYQVQVDEVRITASEGSINVTAPNGTETGTRAWVTSVPYDITWDSAGNVGTVKIDLYGPGGVTWIKSLGTALPNNGVFNTVVHNNEGLYRIRVSDESDGTIYDFSDGDFVLTNDFHITAPDGGEFWYVGQNNTIRWDSPAPVPAINVDLWFSWDGNNQSNLASWIKIDSAVIKPNVMGNNSYVWATPSNDWRFVSEQAKMAVTPKDLPHPLLPGAAKRDFSDDIFTMAGIAITYPSAGVGVKTGNAVGIKWTAAGVGTNGVTIRLYDGTSWSVLSPNAPCVPGTNTFTAVLSGETEAARIDIRSNSGAPNNVYGISDPFTLADINIWSPVGGSAGVRDYWQIGTTNYVKWTASGAGPTVNVEYKTAASTNWFPIAMNTVNINSTTNVTTNTVQWIVQGPPSDTVQVRVKTTDPLQPDLYDTTQPFTVPGIELTAPTGGEVWEFTGTNRVQWLNMGGIGGVDIDVSFDSGATYETVKAGAFTQDGQNYYDLFPGMIRRPSVHAVFRLVQASTISGLPAIDSMERMGTELTIRGMSMAVPTNGAVYTLGTTVMDGLEWFSAFTGDQNADVRYSPDGVNYSDIIMWGASTEFSNLDEDTCFNQYDWVISRRFKPSLNARVKVMAGFYEAVSAPFTMRGIRITTPAKGQMFDIGTSQFVRWDAQALQPAAVASNFVSTSGETGTYIKGGLTDPATILFNALQWDIDPNVDPTTNAVIKMQVYAPVEDTDITVYSEPFTLRGLKVSSPSAGTNWALGSSQIVGFRAAGMGTGARADVYYSPDGVNWDTDNPITNSMPIADGLNTFRWNIESSYTLARTPSTNAHLKVVSGTHTSISPAFTLSGIKITKPMAGDVLAVSDGTSLIEWEAVGTALNFDLSFTVWEGSNSPPPYTENIANVAAGARSFLWPMPITCIGTRVTLMIVSGGVTGYSEEFEVVAQPTVRIQDLWPTMEYLKVGKSKKIEWVKAGDMTNSFALYYAKMPAGSLIQLGTSGAFPLTNGIYSYNWNPIPNNLGPIRIVVTNMVNPSIYDVSTNFTIAPTFEIRAFTADLYALKEHRVYFTPRGSILTGVNLYYSLDPLRGAASWTKINTTPVPAQNNIETYYPWTVADVRTNTVWLRIQDNAYPTDTFSAARPGPYDDYGMFAIKYYRILWRVFDSATSNQLNNLSVADSSGWSGSGLTSPIEHWYPYGTWNTEWYREYFSDEVAFNWNSRSDATNDVWMKRSEIEPDYHVMANFAYDVIATNFMIQTWLERGGAILGTPDGCTIRVYDSGGSLVDTLSGVTTLNGVYWLNWNVAGRGFSSTEVFFARVEIRFSGSTYSSGITFMMRMTASSEIQTVIDQIQNSTTSILDSVAGVNTNVAALRTEMRAGISNLTTAVTNMANDVGAITNAVLTGMAILTNQMDQMVAAVGPLTNMAAQVTSMESDLVSDLARILTRPTTLLYGSTNNILYKTRNGYLHGNVAIAVSNATQGVVASAAMSEVVGGIYEASIVAAWGTNSYVITCSDPRARDSMVVDVVGETMDAVPSIMAAMSNRLDLISDQIASVSNMVIGIAGADLAPVMTGIDTILNAVGGIDVSDIANIQTAVSKLDLSGLNRIESLLGDVSDSGSANTFFGRLADIQVGTDAAGVNAADAAKAAQTAKTEASSASSGIQGVKDALEKGDLEGAYRMLEDVKRSMLASQESVSQIGRMLPLADLHGDLKVMADNMRQLADSRTFKEWITPQEPLPGAAATGAGTDLSDSILVLNRNMEEVRSGMKFMQSLMDELRYEPVVEETLLGAE